MALEIERKFLVADPAFLDDLQGAYFKQGYIEGRNRSAARIRLLDDRAFLTLKGVTRGFVRSEYEYEIPVQDAREMLEELCEKPLIEKMRYEVEFAGNTWEVDVFYGESEGLLMAEIELESEGQNFARPPWLGEEVSDDPRYFNSSLVRNPYRQWDKK
ncbi:MAG: adenylate cyclase [Candidatus Latescibacterota bacterium]